MGARPVGSEDVFAPVRAVADTILYEEYPRDPYRSSSAKNRVRRRFGVLTPPEWTRARGPESTGIAGSAESWWQRTECLLRGPAEEAACTLRFLQFQRRTVERHDGSAYRPAEVLEIGGRGEAGSDEAVPREFSLRLPVRYGEERVYPLEVGSGLDAETIRDADGRPAGRIVRERWPLSVRVRVSAAPAGGGRSEPLTRLRVQVENTVRGIPAGLSRDEALRFSPLACHLLMAVRGSSFVSLLDPPDWARAAVRSCENVRTFPVLAGSAQDHELLLSSPILLYDHPRVAPGSPGDLHGAEPAGHPALPAHSGEVTAR